MNSKLVELELIATPVVMILCYAVIAIFAITQLVNGLYIVAVPLWGGLVIGMIILLLINQSYRISEMENIETVLRIAVIILIIVYVLILVLVLLEIINFDIPLFIAVTSLLMGSVSGILVASCLKVYMFLKSSPV